MRAESRTGTEDRPRAATKRATRDGRPRAGVSGAAARPRAEAVARAAWWIPALWFALGLLCRLVVFQGSHREGDELVYRSLVVQLESGHGYTLRGTPLLADGSWPLDQYGNALFFHPPAGVGLLWLLHSMLGPMGYPIAQLLSYALFFWSMLALVRAVSAPEPLAGPRLHAAAALAAFTPIMTHVMSRFWIDGPMLAAATLAGALFIRSASAGDARGAAVAGLAMGAASWVKTAALVSVPGLLLVAWAMAEPAARSRAVWLGLIFAGIAVAVQLPWELWQWSVVGHPFPAWAGKPSPELVATNAYVHDLTVVRKPWVYLTLLPRSVWTLAPSLLCLATPGFDPRTRRVALALVGWIAVILAVVMGLGAIGYSKLVRYAVLVTPATVALFVVAAGEVWRLLGSSARAPRARSLVRALVLLAAFGLALEVAQGIATPVFMSDRDLIVPLLWPAGGKY